MYHIKMYSVNSCDYPESMSQTLVMICTDYI